MKIFIFLLILAAFLQSSFIPLNLVLILLICRSLASPGKGNLWAAFFSGILVSLLQAENIGFWALVFLLIVKVTSLTRKLPFSRNVLTVFIICALAILVVTGLEHLYLQSSIQIPPLLWETVLAVPVYFILLFWEERFVVKRDTGLKLRR